MSTTDAMVGHDGMDFEFCHHPKNETHSIQITPRSLSRRRTINHQLSSEIAMSQDAARFLCAGTAASLSSFLYNPLDCLRIRWQVVAASAPQTAESGLIQYGSQIVRTEGLVSGLWRPGLAANVSGMFLSAAIRFTSYEPVRDVFIVSSSPEGTSKNGIHMTAAGLVCGAFAYFVTAPFHLLKTLRQAEPVRPDINVADKLSDFRSILRGSAPVSTRGALFTAGQMLGYDGLKSTAKANGFEDGPYLHLISSVAASFGASALSAPADLVVARYMAMTSPGSLIHCVREIYDESGVRGFWRGWSVSFVRLTPVMITYSTVYEQLRYRSGLGYLN